MVSRVAQEELRRLRDTVSSLGRRVGSMLPVATEIVVTGDEEAGRRFSVAVSEVAGEAVTVEEDCEAFLALHAPVAAELRHVVAVLRITPEFVRSATLMANIGRVGVRLAGRSLPVELADQIRRMSGQGTLLLDAAVESHENQVLALADAVADMDDHLDELHRQFIRRVIDARRTDEIDTETAVQLAMVARFYERIGDHAVNVASIVRFEVEGEMSLVAAAEADIAGDPSRARRE